jgi:hypothetical protein
MNYADQDVAELAARAELERLQPSPTNPVPVLVATYNRRTQQTNQYSVVICIGITAKTIWRRDKFAVSVRGAIKGAVVKVLHAVDSDRFAAVTGIYAPLLKDVKQQIKDLQAQREGLENELAANIEEKIITA